MTVDQQIAALKEQVRLLSDQAGEQRAVVDRMGKDVHVHEQQLRPVRGAPLVNRKQADASYGPKAMRKHLGASGAAPLHIGGLKGSAGEAQPASIPEVAALPQLGDASVKAGTVLHHQGANFRKGKAGWEKL